MGRSYSSGGPPVPFDFELDGVQFVAVGGVQTLELSELALHDTENPNSAAGMASTAMVFRHALGDDYERFRQHCREHGGDHLGDTLLEIIRDMVEHLAESPTKPSGRSSSGRQDTGGTSKAEPRETPQLTIEEIRRWRAANEEGTRSPE